MDSLGSTALFSAIKDDDHQAVEDILSLRSFLINDKNDNGDTALIYAIKNGNYSITELLIKKGANILDRDTASSQTALHLAVTNGDEDLTNLLIKHGVRINVMDAHDETSLYVAVREGHYRIAAILLGKGAQTNCSGRSFITPLHWAILNNDEHMVELMLSYGANVNAIDHSGMTPLHYAVKQNNYRIAQLLAHKNPDPDILDSYFHTPLTFAISKTEDHISIVSVLCQMNAIIDLKKDKIREYFLDNFEILLRRNTDTNSSIFLGLKILTMFYAIEQEWYDFTKLIPIMINHIEGYKNSLFLKLDQVEFSEIAQSRSTEFINQLTKQSLEWNRLKEVFISKEPMIYKALEELLKASNNILNGYNARNLPADPTQCPPIFLPEIHEQAPLIKNKSFKNFSPRPEIQTPTWGITELASTPLKLSPKSSFSKSSPHPSPYSSPKTLHRKTLEPIKTKFSPAIEPLFAKTTGSLYTPTKLSFSNLGENVTSLDQERKSAVSPSKIKLKVTDPYLIEHFIDLPNDTLNSSNSNTLQRSKTSPRSTISLSTRPPTIDTNQPNPFLDFSNDKLVSLNSSSLQRAKTPPSSPKSKLSPKAIALEVKLDSTLNLHLDNEVYEDAAHHHVHKLGDDGDI